MVFSSSIAHNFENVFFFLPLCDSQSWNDGNCLFVLRFWKASPRCSVSVHSVKNCICAPRSSVSFSNTPLAAPPILQILHGWRSTVSATVTRQTVKWKLRIYIYYIVMEKETVFWNKETMVYLLFWKAVSFQNTSVQYLHLAIQIQLWVPEKGPQKIVPDIWSNSRKIWLIWK